MPSPDETPIATVNDLWSDQPDAEERIIRLSKSRSHDNEPSAGVSDAAYSEAFLDALRWGLGRYGLTLEGNDFYEAICCMEKHLRHRFGAPAAKIGEKLVHVGPSNVISLKAYTPSLHRSRADQPENLVSMNLIRRNLKHHLSSLDNFNSLVGISILNVGFSDMFSVPAVIIFDSHTGIESSFLLEGYTHSCFVPPVVVIPGSFQLSSQQGQADLDLQNHDQVFESIVAKAQRMTRGNATTRVEISERMLGLNCLKSPIRASWERNPVRHGSSIGLSTVENKGSAGVYVTPSSPTGVFKVQPYLLTASHVIKIPDIPENFKIPFPYEAETKTEDELVSITTPGRLDSIKEIYSLIRRKYLDEELRNWITASENPCGRAVCSRMGVDSEGWREDWALLDLEGQYRGFNGNWWDLDYFFGLWSRFGGTEKKIEAFVGDVVGVEDPEPGSGELWFKDGAGTGWSVGRPSGVEVYLILRGSAMSVKEEARESVCEENILEPKMVAFFSALNGAEICEGGDSGSGLFKLNSDATNFVFGGQVVSMFCPDKGRNIALAVPQSRLLEQLEEKTGVQWRLT